MKNKVIAVPYYIWSGLFIVVPLLFVGYYAFTDATGAFTTENVMQIGRYWDVLWRSICYAVIATACCLLIGYRLAYIMAKQSENVKNILLILLMLPMWINFVLRTQALQNLLMDNGFINQFFEAVGLPAVQMLNTPFAVVLGLIYNYLPFMVLPIFTALEKMDPTVLEAAQDLGASKWNTFRRVILPLSMPGVFSGIIMVLIPTISTFVISEKLGGGKQYLIGNAINDMFNQNYNFNVGAAISLVMMVIILLTMIIFNTLDDETKEGLI